jgi:hypothetical protein
VNVYRVLGDIGTNVADYLGDFRKMKPLVYYCRWQGATLRLQGRGETAVWGQLVFMTEAGESTQNFRFDLQTWQLTLEEGEETKQIQLDEMGVVV